MSTIIDLRRIFNIKKLITLLVLNFLNDVISISSYLSANGSDNYILFERFFCTNLGIISFAMYISFYVLVTYCIINRVHEDNQKYGVFYLVRYQRKKYAFVKLCSTIIFIFSICILTYFQSYFNHYIMKINIDIYQYLISMIFTFFIAYLSSQIALLVYSIFKNTNISFLVSLITLALLSIIFTFNNVKIPTKEMVSNEYFYTCLGLLLIFPNLIINIKQDFITTKIKE